MSYLNGTPNYDLPQTIGSDVRDWFDTNIPFANVDKALHDVVVESAENKSRLDADDVTLADHENRVTSLETRVTTAENDIDTLEANVATIIADTADQFQDIMDMIDPDQEDTAVATGSYAVGDRFIYNDTWYKCTVAISVGDTIVPDTNCTAINVDSELQSLISTVDSQGDSTTSNSEDSMVATKNYAVGEYIMIDGVLYKVIATINSGDALVEGTNIQRVTITDELTTVSDDIGDTSDSDYTDALSDLGASSVTEAIVKIFERMSSMGGISNINYSSVQASLVNTSGTITASADGVLIATLTKDGATSPTLTVGGTLICSTAATNVNGYTHSTSYVLPINKGTSVTVGGGITSGTIVRIFNYAS